jgi:hypothetical protein
MNAAEADWDIGMNNETADETTNDTTSGPRQATMRDGLGQKTVASVK